MPLLLVLLVFVPIAIVLEVMHAPAMWIFVCSGAAIIPLAGLMGKATEHLAHRMGAGIGGLLNATFGNAAELIIAFMALRSGLYDVVRASITGSIIGNVLLVLGLALLVGGIKFERQKFNRVASSLGATLMALSAVGLLVPALFHAVVEDVPGHINTEHALSLSISIVLLAAYVLSVIFQLITHKHLFAGEDGHGHDEEEAVWSVGKAVGLLLVATVAVAVMSEFLVGAVEETAEIWGLTEIFVGVIVVAVIGNAAEHSTAVLMAIRNRMDLSINIAIGSSIQVALFVAPVLHFASYVFGEPMDLVFTPFEVVAVGLTVAVLALVANDGESHWMEGVLLLAVYLILGIAFFFLPESHGARESLDAVGAAIGH
ncbi:MAG: calcium/proton exchanger [Candidatus Hydrogenedentes bacterium]|nr:calcium/proton exchanger [Candidatus Hydrogenedentota bacterium]